MNRRKNKAKCVFTINKNGKPYRYMTRVIIRGQKFYLGCYKTEKEAFDVYKNFIDYVEKNNIGDQL